MKIYCVALDEDVNVGVGSVDWWLSEEARDKAAVKYLTSPPIARKCVLFEIDISGRLWMQARFDNDAAISKITDMVDELVRNNEYKKFVTGYKERAL